MSDFENAHRIRRADRGLLDAALAHCRAGTLRAFGACERALQAERLRVPYSPQINPPLWELGHVGWFQEYWIARNPERRRGVAADPQAPRARSILADADTLYDSGRVEHASRWHLPLPDAAGTRDYLERTLEQTRTLLARADDGPGSDGLRYFAWLALMHEDMHLEAMLYTAHALGFDPGVSWPVEGSPPDGQTRELLFDAARVHLGASDDGFAFDNELPAHWVQVDAFRIDRSPVSNAAYIAFVEEGGYREPRHWTDEGWAWRSSLDLRWPRYWRPGAGGDWHCRMFGRLERLDGDAPAVNLSLHEAQAWCRWAGRRLPTEAEWERAATAVLPPAGAGVAVDGAGLQWGQVWEWTATQFAPYPGFTPHPYREYSAPWFDSRQVLRGASFATQPRLRHPCYRNFFTPDRNDIFAGFRSCALAA